MQRGIHHLARRSLTGAALAVLVLTAGLLSNPAQAATATGRLTLTGLSFAQSSVDASGGSATVDLNWTVKDSNQAATSVTGDVQIRLAGAQPGSYVGQVYDIAFGQIGYTGLSSSGTAQDSSYSYAFAVPQYSFAATAHWDVVQVTAQDDQGNSLSVQGSHLNRYSGVLTATELVDSTPPGYDSLQFPIVLGPSRPYVYNGGSGGSSSYSFNADDAQSGFWKGVLTLLGPGGATLSARFSYTYSLAEGAGACGSGTVFDDTSAWCQPTVTIPASAPSGTWTVTRLDLWDNAGNHAAYRNLNVLPITVTSNSAVQASGFTASPNPVNNWTQTQTVQIGMNVSGAQDGVATIYVDFAAGGPCEQQSTTPTANADGTYSVPVSMFSIASSCTVAGVAVLDGAGNLAVYGPEYGGPGVGIQLSRVPDTTPPVATGASLSATSLPQTAGSIGLTVDVDDAIAPVTGFSATVFNSSGFPVGGADGGLPATLNGPVSTSVYFSTGLPPGTYTVAFQLTDEGGLESSYGYPNSQPVPGGPLQFTITS